MRELDISKRPSKEKEPQQKPIANRIDISKRPSKTNRIDISNRPSKTKKPPLPLVPRSDPYPYIPKLIGETKAPESEKTLGPVGLIESEPEKEDFTPIDLEKYQIEEMGGFAPAVSADVDVLQYEQHEQQLETFAIEDVDFLDKWESAPASERENIMPKIEEAPETPSVASLTGIDIAKREPKEEVKEKSSFTKDNEGFALSYYKEHVPGVYEDIIEQIKNKRFSEEDEINLVSKGAGLKKDILSKKAEFLKRQILEDSRVALSELLPEGFDFQSVPLSEIMDVLGEIEVLKTEESEELKEVARKYRNLELGTMSYIGQDFKKKAEEIERTRILQNIANDEYQKDPVARAMMNTFHNVIRGITGVLVDVTKLPGVDALSRAFNPFMHNNAVELSEATEKWTNSLMDTYFPISEATRMGRDVFEEQATVSIVGEDGLYKEYQAAFSGNEIIEVRKNGVSVSKRIFDTVTSKYEKFPTERTLVTDGELLLSKVFASATEIGLLIGGSRLLLKGATRLGFQQKAAENLSLWATNYTLMQDDLYQSAREEGVSEEGSIAFSIVSSITMTAAMRMSPSKFIFGKADRLRFTKNYAKIIDKGVPVKKAIAATFRDGAKESVGFNLFVANLAVADRGTKWLFNQLGSNFDTEFFPDPTNKKAMYQFGEEVVINSILGFGIGVSQGLPSAQMSRIQRDAWWSASKEMDKYIPKIEKKIESGEISKDKGEEIIAMVKLAGGYVEAMPKNLQKKEQSELLSLMIEKKNLTISKEDPLKDVKDKGSEKRLTEIEDRMNDILNKDVVVEEAEKEPIGEKVKRFEGEAKSLKEKISKAEKEGKNEEVEKLKQELEDIESREKESKVELEKTIAEEKEIGDLLKLKKFTTPTEEAFGEVIETDKTGKEIRRETLTREQFEKEQERKGKPEETLTDKAEQIDAEVEVLEAKIGDAKVKGEETKELEAELEAKNKEQQEANIKAVEAKSVDTRGKLPIKQLIGREVAYKTPEGETIKGKLEKGEKGSVVIKPTEGEPHIIEGVEKTSTAESLGIKVEADKPAEAKEKPTEMPEVWEPKSKEDIEVAMGKVFGLPKKQAKAVADMYDAVAESWAKKQGKTKEDWYKEKIAVIKRGTVNGKDVLYQDTEIGETFYSNTKKVVEGIKQEKGAADVLKGKIRKGEGIKKAEIEWIGLDTFLKENPKATKTEILDFIEANKIEVKEVILREKGYIPREPEGWKLTHEEGGREVYTAESKTAKYVITEVDKVRSVGGEIRGQEEWQVEIKEKFDKKTRQARARGKVYGSVYAAKRSVEFSDTDIKDANSAEKPAKYKEYTLPGAKEGTYKEILLVMPNLLSAKGKEVHIENKKNIKKKIAKNEEEANKVNREIKEVKEEIDKTYDEVRELIGYNLLDVTPSISPLYREFNSGRLETPTIRKLEKAREGIINNRDWVNIGKAIEAEYNKQKVLADKLKNLHEKWGDLVNNVRVLSGEIEDLKLDYEEKPEEFKEGGHYDKSNIAAHTRVDTRTDVEGNKVLHIAEVQSDWAQKGRKRGWKDSAELEKTKEGLTVDVQERANGDLVIGVGGIEFGKHYTAVSKKNASREATGKYVLTGLLRHKRSTIKNATREEAIEGAKTDVAKTILEDKLPDMPFKKNWHEIVMKTMIRHAVEQGFDRITWDTGKTNADRYDLSKQVDGIDVSIEKDGTYLIEARKEQSGDERGFGRVVNRQEGVRAENLENIVGKDLANKIIKDSENVVFDSENPTRNLFGSYREKDLKVGGEGMKAFYDKILTAFMKKYGKKYGAKVGKTEVKIVDEAVTEADFNISTRFSEGAKEVREPDLVSVDVVEKTSGRLVKTFNRALDVGDVEGKRKAGKELTEEADAFIKDLVVKRGDVEVLTEKAHSFDITPEMKDFVMEGQPLYQGKKAAIQFTKDGKAIITALTDPNVSSPMHELSHMFERDLVKEDQKTVLDWASEKTFNTKAKEKFARGFEKFLVEGKVLNKKLNKIFEKFKEWLSDIYKGGIKYEGKEIVLNDKMRSIYNQILETRTVKEIEKDIKAKEEKRGTVTGKERIDIKKEIKELEKQKEKIAEIEAKAEKKEPKAEKPTEKPVAEKKEPKTKKPEVEVKSEKEIAEENKKERRKVVKDETGHELEDTKEEVEAEIIERNKALNIIEKTRQRIKEGDFTPEDLKGIINIIIDKIRKLKAKGDTMKPWLRDIEDEFLDDVESKSSEAKGLKELGEQFNRINEEIENVASKDVKRILIKGIDNQLKLKNRKGLTDFVNSELDKFNTKTTNLDPESLAMDRLKKSAEHFIKNPLDIMPEKLAREIELLDKQNLWLLSNNELKEILDDIKLLKKEGKTVNRLKRAIQQRKLDKLEEEFNNIISGGKGVDLGKKVLPENRKKQLETFNKHARNVIGGTLLTLSPYISTLGIPNPLLKTKLLKDAFDMNILKNMLNSNVMFDILDEAAGGKPFEGNILKYFREGVNRARDRQIIDVQSKTERLEKMIKVFNLEGRLKDSIKLNIGDKGEEVDFTRDQVIRMHMSIQDPMQRKSMLNKKVGNKLTEDDLWKISESLTEMDKQFGNWMIDFYEDIFPELNKEFKKINNHSLTRYPNYSPMFKEGDLLNKKESLNIIGFHTSGKSRNIENVKFSGTEKRTGSEVAINFKMGATQMLLEYIIRSAHYKALAGPLQEMNSVIQRIKPAVIQNPRLGKKYHKLLEEWVESIANDGRYTVTDFEGFLKSMRVGFTRGVLGLNIVTSIKQSVSATAFLTELGIKDFAKGINEYWHGYRLGFEGKDTKHGKWNEFINDNVPQVKMRGQGGWLDRDMKDAMDSRQAFDKAMNPRIGKHRLQDVSMQPIRAMDGWTVRAGFVMAYLSRVPPGWKLGDPYNAEAGSYALGLIERTQPRGDIKDLSSFQKGSELNKLVTMFMNQPNQYYNIIYSNLRSYSNGRIGRGQLAQALVYGWVVPTVAFGAMSKGFTPSEEEITSLLLSTPARNVFVMGNMIDAVRTSFDFQASPIEGLVDEMVHELRHLKQGEVARSLFNISLLVSQASGVPVNQLERTTKGIYNIATGETTDIREAIWSKYALKSDDKADWGLKSMFQETTLPEGEDKEEKTEQDKFLEGAGLLEDNK